MAYTTAHQKQTTPIASVAVGLLPAFFNALTRIAENNPRYRKIRQLSAMSDTELAEIGLRRTDIARHVFADQLYI